MGQLGSKYHYARQYQNPRKARVAPMYHSARDIGQKEFQLKSVKIFDKFDMSQKQKKSKQGFVPKFLSISNIQEESDEMDISKEEFKQNQTGTTMGENSNSTSLKRVKTIYKKPQPTFKTEGEKTRNFKKLKQKVQRNGHKKSKSLIDHPFFSKQIREVSESKFPL